MDETPEVTQEADAQPTPPQSASSQAEPIDEHAGGQSRQSAEEQAEIASTVEAMLLASENPLSLGKISQVADLTAKAVRQAVALLNDRYEKMGCSFRVQQLAGGYQITTLPQYADVLSRLLAKAGENKLSAAAMETLSIVAYRQPLIRADIEAIRGVACGEVLRSLMEKQLVKIVGRAEVLGRPMLYGTTRRFLEVFGLASLEDLPRVEELRSGADKAKTAPTPEPPATPAG